MEASAPVVQPVLSPEAAREPGVDPSVVLPAVDTPVVVATGPTAGLQYDGSIAFRRVVK